MFSINPDSSSRHLKSSHKASAEIRPTTGIGKFLKAYASDVSFLLDLFFVVPDTWDTGAQQFWPLRGTGDSDRDSGGIGEPRRDLAGTPARQKRIASCLPEF